MRLFGEIIPITKKIEQKLSTPNKKRSKSDANAVLKYSGMAFQMAIIIGLGVWAGMKLDEHFGNETAYLTALCALLALPVAFYVSLKDLF